MNGQRCLLLWVFLMMATGACTSMPSGSRLVTYPATAGSRTSNDFAVSVGGRPVWVEKVGPGRTDEQERYSTREDLNVASFSCSGEQVVTIRVLRDEKIGRVMIRPKSRGIAAAVNGDEISFKIAGPQKLYVEVNNLAHLAIFANPLEENPPTGGAPNVTYFGPGVHTGDVALRSDHTYYLAGGSLVKGTFTGSGVRNVKIIGRGSIDGRVQIGASSHVEVNGVFIRNSIQKWTNTLSSCNDIAYRNVKIFSYGPVGNDGIDIVGCRQATVDDCFIRTRDDCVAVKTFLRKGKAGEASKCDPAIGITVTNCVFVGWLCGDGVTVGFENDCGVSDVHVRNCDVLYATGPGTTTGHSAFSICCDGPGTVSGVVFEDIRAEEMVTNNAVELVVTPGNMWGTRSGKPGHVRGVVIRNCTWENPVPPFRVTGFGPENIVEDVTFENCTVGGKPLDASRLIVNEYTRNIRVTQASGGAAGK